MNVAAEGGASTAPYRNVMVSRVNDGCLRLSAFEGDYPWHAHPDSDELFVVVEGRLVVEVEGGPVFELGPWDTVTVPAGVVHRTRALPRAVNLTVERADATTTFVDPPAAPAHAETSHVRSSRRARGRSTE